METLLEAVGATVVPAAVILVGIVYPLRPQGGTRQLRPHATPAAATLARLNAEWKTENADRKRRGLPPIGQFGDTSKPPAWTAPAQPRQVMTA